MPSTSNTTHVHRCTTEQAFKEIASNRLLSSLTRIRETQLAHGFLATGIDEVSTGVKKFLEVGGEELQINSQPLVAIRRAIWDLAPGDKLKVNFPTDISLKRAHVLECPWIDVTCFSEDKFLVAFGNGSSGTNLRAALESFSVFNLAKLDLEINFIPGHPGVKSFSESFAVTLLQKSLSQSNMPAHIDQNGDLCFSLGSSSFKVTAAIKFWSTSNVRTERTEDGLFLIAPDLSAHDHPPETLSLTISHEPTHGTEIQLFEEETLSRASSMIMSSLIGNFGVNSRARIEGLKSIC